MGDCGGFNGSGDGKFVVIEVGSRSSSSGSSLSRSVSPSPSPSSSPDQIMMNEECWAAAEEAGQEVLNWIHPTIDSEDKRKDVIDYIQKLIKNSLGCEVYPFGSVPLKTYLPDGDIDLTALSSLNSDEVLPQDVLALLQEEEQNENAEYQVKEIQFIDAEVKLVKCLVQNIVVDISFNQLGGLCTLCFLEQVDRFIEKDHLFKRSIFLVKAWCYYESRILGAHHGLISTYALETLVLYIFHRFHSSLTGPLKVLYIFLDYFSKFDWDRYCISLNGPVCKLSLPRLIFEMPDNGGNDLLLSEEFLGNCLDMFTVPCRGAETTKKFVAKHLNIIDPLKENNNLGRSVHRGNFYRIRSAFKYGARKLGRILSSPRDRIADEIKDFYANTLERHGRKYGKDLRRPLIVFGAEGYLNLSSYPAELFSEDDMLLKSSIGGFENESSIRVEDKCASVFSDELNVAGLEVESYCQIDSSDSLDETVGFDVLLEHSENSYEDVCSKCSSISSPKIDPLETLSPDFRERDFASLTGDSELLNPMADLSGDYYSNMRNLLNARDIHGHTLPVSVVQSLPPSTSRFRSMKSWDTVRQSMPLGRKDSFSQTNSNFVYAGPPLDMAGNSAPSSVAAIDSEEKRKGRGIGTYFPNTNCYCRERRSQGGRVRNKAPGSYCQLQRHIQNNGASPMLSETSSLENGSPHSRSSVLGQRESRISTQSEYSAGADTRGNGSSNDSCKLEFGSLGDLPEILLSDSNHTLFVKGKTSKSVPDTKERGAEQSFHLKNEEEFPPLSM